MKRLLLSTAALACGGCLQPDPADAPFRQPGPLGVNEVLVRAGANEGEASRQLVTALGGDQWSISFVSAYFDAETDKAAAYQLALDERVARLRDICTDGIVELRRSAYGVYTDESLPDQTGKPSRRLIIAIDAQCPRGIRENGQTAPVTSE